MQDFKGVIKHKRFLNYLIKILNRSLKEVVWLIFPKLFLNFSSSLVLEVEIRLPTLSIQVKLFLEPNRDFSITTKSEVIPC